MIIYFSLILVSISLFLMGLNYVLCTSNENSREKFSIFECGFDPSVSSRLPFSMHFFLVALIFLIFDVEISILIPVPLMWSHTNQSLIFWITLFVLMILLAGALVEWVEGSLEWHS